MLDKRIVNARMVAIWQDSDLHEQNELQERLGQDQTINRVYSLTK